MDEFENWIWEQDLSDSRIVRDALLLLEMYEAVQIVEKRIDKRMDEMLEGLGFSD